MAARDRWEIALSCKACGTAGEAKVSENDYPFMNRLDFSVDAIDPAFVVKREGNGAFDTEFACANCGGPVK